jgi:rfaE bifunctional protein kinase chain/domain
MPARCRPFIGCWSLPAEPEETSMNLDRLRAILDCFPGLNILVLGDFFLDKYLIIEHARAEISLETGLEVHQVVEVRCSPGAAGTVTSNLRAMEVNVWALGVIGDDGEGFELLRALRNTGVEVSGLVVSSDRVTPTYTKPLLQEPDSGQRELNRLDIKNRAPLPPDAEDEVIERLRDLLPRVDGVIVADQVPEADCGVITARIRAEIGALARAYPRVVFLVDSRERIGLFRDVMLKPNARESLRATCPAGQEEGSTAAESVAPSAALASGAELYRRAGRPVFLTLGADGIAVFAEDGLARIPAVPASGPIDIVGAGDATMAGICSALCAGATAPEAAQTGCLAAAVTIQQIGTTGTASRAQILDCWQRRG